MPAAFSYEGRLETGLRELDCSGRNFVVIAKLLGAQISDGGFSQALSGKKPFDHDTGTKLMDVLQRLQALQDEIDLPVDWSQIQRVTNALTVRLVAKIAAELQIENTGLQESATQMTKRIRQSASAAPNQ